MKLANHFPLQSSLSKPFWIQAICWHATLDFHYRFAAVLSSLLGQLIQLPNALMKPISLVQDFERLSLKLLAARALIYSRINCFQNTKGAIFCHVFLGTHALNSPNWVSLYVTSDVNQTSLAGWAGSFIFGTLATVSCRLHVL